MASTTEVQDESFVLSGKPLCKVQTMKRLNAIIALVVAVLSLQPLNAFV
jgi:hypothetical protein